MRRGGRAELASSPARSSSEYSIWTHTRGAARARKRAARGQRRRLPAGHPTPRRSARARSTPPPRQGRAGLLERHAASKPCTCHRSTWSEPEPVQRGVEGPQQAGAASVGPALGAAPTPTAVVASDHRVAAPRRSPGAHDRLGLAVAVDVRGVDEGAAGIDERHQLGRGLVARRCRDPRSWCPAPSRETCRPLRPSERCSMAST